MELKKQQQQAFDAIKDFVQNQDSQVFILKGYAGTGKTTMIKTLVPFLSQYRRDVRLMAPTGRAAKMLREKSGYPATTIHKAIYSADKFVVMRHDENGKLVDIVAQPSNTKKDSGVDELHFIFQINKTNQDYDPKNSVIIVDEASMVSSVASNNDHLHFGTDILLNDLLTFAQLHKGAKIIFVGDPAQLPPVGDNKSAALDENYFIEKKIKVDSFQLTEVLRQDEGNAILKNSMLIRDVLNSEQRNSLQLEYKEGEVESISPEDIINQFIENQPLPSIGASIIICFTNAKVKEYNDHIREQYFPGMRTLQPGDVLQIVKNNYSHETELYNGDFVKVLSVDPNIVTHSAPVWVDRNGERKREIISIHYVKAFIQTEDGSTLNCYLVDNLLLSPLGNLSVEQNTSMYIDFRMRNESLIKQKNLDGLTSALRTDPFYNAIQAKYGYAITCHKSQGGEWPTAFVDYTGRTGLNDDCLRWCYTATTRASQKLFGVNIPNISPFSKFKINDINKVSRTHPDALSYANVLCADMPDAKPFQKVKYNTAESALAMINCSIKSVTQLPYRDRYVVVTPDGDLTIDCIYNGSGIYTSITSKANNEYTNDVMQAFNTEVTSYYSFKYEPSRVALGILYRKITSICDDFGITITNVIEKDWVVTYFFKTTGKFSYLQCYFDKNGFIRSAIPSSDLGKEDILLQSLIEKLI